MLQACIAHIHHYLLPRYMYLLLTRLFSTMKVNINLWDKLRGKPIEHPENGNARSRVHSTNQSRVQSTDQSRVRSSDEPNVIIIRNTTHPAPNITHNRYKNTGRGELYLAACFGVLLQIGVISYCGIITQFPRIASKFQKDGSPVGSYAFPLTTVGTVVLSIGMFICCRVVESRTKEHAYRPTKNWRARMVWLQRETTVGDQEFKSFALYTGEDQPIIITSERKDPSGKPNTINTAGQQQHNGETNHQTQGSQDNTGGIDRRKKSLGLMTIMGTTISLVGFFAQFIGIRGMHWSASVASLIAILMMTAVRAWVRRGLAKRMHYKPLRPGFELDWFANTLRDIPSAPWYDPDKEKGRGRNPPTEQNESSNINEAQHCIERRRELANLARCQGPVSKEAIAVTLAIEATMNLLNERLDQKISSFSWHYNVENTTNAARFQLNVKKQEESKWKANAGEIEAALSLRLFYDKSQQEAQSLATIIPKSDNPSNDDTWLRLKGEVPDMGIRILGPNTMRLLRHLDWWIPEDGPQIWKGEARYVSPTNAGTHVNAIGNISASSTEFEIDESRVVGLDPRTLRSTDSSSSSTVKSASQLSFPYYQKSKRGKWKFKLPNEPNEGDDLLSVYIKTLDPLEVLYAKDMFSTFMWAVVEILDGSIEDKTDVQTSRAILDKDEDSWRRLVLRNDFISRCSLAIQSSGLCNIHEAYINVILPLCMQQKLPKVDGIIELVRSQTRELEARHLWKDAGKVYLQLSRHLAAFSVNSYTYIRAIAVLVTFRNALPKANPDADLAQKLMENANKELEQNLDSLCKFRDVDIDIDFDPTHEHLFRLAEKYRDLGIDHSVPRAHEVELEEKGKIKDIFDRTPLHYCAVFIYRPTDITGNTETSEDKISSERYLQAAQQLIDNGTDINGCDIRGWTPLHYACHTGKTSIHVARLLLEKNADANVRGRDGTAPIHCAVTEGHFEIVKLLVEFGANIDVLDGSGSTALHAAVLKRSAETFKLLCAQSRKIRDKQGRTAFHIAAMTGFSDAMKHWNSDVNSKDNAGKTPLYLAFEWGQKEFVQQLLNFPQVDIDVTHGDEKRTALHLACIKGYSDIVETLLDKGVDKNAMDGRHRTPLFNAVIRREESIVKLLTEKGADVNAMNRWGRAPLHYAVAIGNSTIFEHLVSAKEADVNVGAGTAEGTPLHEASITTSDHNWIQDLIDFGADPDAVDDEGKTPLHYAASDGYPANIQRLIDAKAKKEARDMKRCTPLLSATENYDKQGAKICLRLLIKLGADVNAANEDGRTVLHEVAVNENLADLIPELLSADARIEQTDADGSTALHRAALTRCIQGIKVLIERGANVETVNHDGKTPRSIIEEWGGPDWLKKNTPPSRD